MEHDDEVCECCGWHEPRWTETADCSVAQQWLVDWQNNILKNNELQTCIEGLE